MSVDAAALTADLIRCRSVTPEEGGALTLLEALLAAHGFRCTRVDRGGIANLYARWGEAGPVFGFNGHIDVVPPGNEEAWTHPPFSGAEHGGEIWGRGAVDMKSGVAAFAAAACDLVSEAPPKGSVALLITGDEEGAATDGTVAILDWMRRKGEALDACLVGEPTCPTRLGEMIKIGRRGSMTGFITAQGVQGHSAYPHRARNPLPALVRLLDRLAAWEMDGGTEHFDPSTLAITTIDVGNPANNVIPPEGRATVNIRFNDAHSSNTIKARIEADAAEVASETGVSIAICWQVSGESFLTPPGPLSTLVAAAVEAETGVKPVLSTSGGTSDARFIRQHCPVVEFGLVGTTMHQVDERVPVAEVQALKAIYRRVLESYFAG